MTNIRLKMATLAIGTVLMLLAPVTAAARGRDEFQTADQDRGRTEQRYRRNPFNNDELRYNDARDSYRHNDREGNRFQRDRGFQDRFHGYDEDDRR